MGHTSTSVTSVRPYLSTGVAVASAGILAASLVVAPPEFSVARTEGRGVQLIAFALPSTASAAATLEKFVRSQGQTVVPVTPVSMGAADITGAVVTSPVKLVEAVRSTGSPTRVIDATAQSVLDPAIESQQVTAAATLDVITDPILRSIVAVGFFFVVIPVFWVIVIVTSAINVVLDALGLPLLPNVPDPPFGPTPPLIAAAAPAVESKPLSSEPVAPNTDKSASSTGIVETDRLSSDPVAPNTHKSASSTGILETDRLSSDPVAPDTDTANTSKPVMNVAKDSPVFTPKPRGRDSSSPDSDLVRTAVEAPADDASTVEQQPVGRVGKKPKPDAANEEQKPGHDPSATRSVSQ